MSEAEEREEIERRHRMDDHAVRSGKQIGLGWRQAHEDRAVLLDALQARDTRFAELEAERDERLVQLEYTRKERDMASYLLRERNAECDALAERLRRAERIIVAGFGMSTDQGRVAAYREAKAYCAEFLPPAP
jgi:hypothetical protein